MTRILTFLNAAGCLALIALVVLQWAGERRLRDDLKTTTAELAAATTRELAQEQRRAALEQDIRVLKDAITSTQQAAEDNSRDLGAASTLASRLETELAAAREQVTAWEAALKARDERIQVLGSELAATRKRLDEAVAKLKAAARRTQ